MKYDKVTMYPPEAGPIRFSLIKEGCLMIIVIGFNPSTASDTRADSTMRSVMAISESNGYDGFAMLNIYPLRATNPEALPTDIDENLHCANFRHINEVLDRYPGADILLAYGNLVDVRPYTRRIAGELLDLLNSKGRNVLCISILKTGNPKHPLYTSKNARLIPYIMR